MLRGLRLKCPACKSFFVICSPCYTGHRYCSDDCRSRNRTKYKKQRNQRYSKKKKSRLLQRQRQNRYLKKQRMKGLEAHLLQFATKYGEINRSFEGLATIESKKQLVKHLLNHLKARGIYSISSGLDNLIEEFLANNIKVLLGEIFQKNSAPDVENNPKIELASKKVTDATSRATSEELRRTSSHFREDQAACHRKHPSLCIGCGGAVSFITPQEFREREKPHEHRFRVKK